MRWLLSGLSLCVLLLSACSQSPQQPEWTQIENHDPLLFVVSACSEFLQEPEWTPFGLEILVDSKEVEQGEELNISAEIKNNSFQPISFFFLRDPAREFLVLRITDPDGKLWNIDPSMYGPSSLDPPPGPHWLSFTLRKGETYEVFVLRWTFDKTGTYRIEALMPYLGIVAKAKPVEIRVRPKGKPKGK